jgi:hypothetical protein
MWSNGGMIVTGGSRSTERKTNFTHRISRDTARTAQWTHSVEWQTDWLTDWLTYCLSRVFDGKQIVFQLVTKLLCILWTPTVYYHVCKIPSVVPILSQMSPIHTLPFIKNIFFLFSSHVSSSFPHAPHRNTCASLRLPPIHATCSAHIILHCVVARIIFGDR